MSATVVEQTGHPARTRIMVLMAATVVLAVALVAAVNLAIPTLAASELRPSPAQILWIVDAYVIVFACLLIPAGAAGDRFGRKGVLLAGLGVFAAGCLAAALAPDVTTLVAARALSGAGAAMVMPASLALTVGAYPAAARGHAVAAWTAATGAAGVIGNVGGGLVMQYLPWRALFGVPVALAVVLALLVAVTVPRAPRHDAVLDLPGAGLLTAASVALLVGIIEGPEAGWGSGLVLGALAVAAALFAVFAAYQLRAARPLLDPRLFRVARLRAGTLGVAVTFFGLFALFFMNARFLQEVKGFSPLLTGVAIVPLTVPMVILSRLSARLSPRTAVPAGLAGNVAGLLLLSFAGAGMPYPVYMIGLLVMGAAMGLCLPVLSHEIMAALPRERAGLGSGLNSATRELGSAVGVAVMGTVSATHGMAAGYRVIAGVVLAGGLLVIRWLTSGERGSA
ncbi:MFS transporter [Actinomadura sp. ATCC 31491]|uniref:MFS transporter n=1 Tax=Actinomadura luzonensis TaxID=2805427 RepID=A0ABT0G808_9ACTN|nr:MFS transporter [Actinomadura luzonensis]MCK2220729.1 MFS transporter [Actinomadura luzonensis]